MSTPSPTDPNVTAARNRLITHFGAAILSNRKNTLHQVVFREGHLMKGPRLDDLVLEALKWANVVVKLTGEPP